MTTRQRIKLWWVNYFTNDDDGYRVNDYLFGYDRTVVMRRGHERSGERGRVGECGLITGDVLTIEEVTTCREYGRAYVAPDVKEYRLIDGSCIWLMRIEWEETGLCSDGTPEGEARCGIAMDLAGD